MAKTVFSFVLMEAGQSVHDLLGLPLLESKTGRDIRSTVGSLQEETVSFFESSDVLQQKALSLSDSARQMSKSLHEFATAVAQMAGSPADVSKLGNSQQERDILLGTAEALSVLAASVQHLEDSVRNKFLLGVQQVRSVISTSFAPAMHDAAEARVELEAEAKKTAVQMSKKHAQAERRSSDVAFGDLLKIQASLKSVEKRFESSASQHLSSMLRVRQMRRTVITGNLLTFEQDLEDSLVKATEALRKVSRSSKSYVETDLPKFNAAWEAETAKRDALVARMVSDCCYGTNNHMEGYLNMTLDGKRHRRYFVLAGGFLTQYQEWSEFRVEREYDLLLFHVKPIDGSATEFEVQSPMMTLIFEANSETKRNKWLACFAENISNKLDAHKQTTKSATSVDESKKKEVMSSVVAVSGNKTCADCDSADPTWISLNYGVLICHQCSGVHRKIGTHLSKVRSLTLDIIDDELRDMMMVIGNAKANSLLELSIDRRKPAGGSKREVREEFITEKYSSKKFCPKSSDTPDTLAAILYDAIRSSDILELELLKYVLLGANLKWKHPDSGETLLHAVLASDQTKDPYVFVQILVYNDCLVDAPSGKNQERPLHLAARFDFIKSCRVLLRNGADPNAITSNRETPLDLLPRAAHPHKGSSPDIQAYLFPDERRRSMTSSATLPAATLAAVSPSGSPSSSSLSPDAPSGRPRSSSVLDSPSVSRKPRRMSIFSKKGSSSSPTSSPSLRRHKDKNLMSSGEASPDQDKPQPSPGRRGNKSDSDDKEVATPSLTDKVRRRLSRSNEDNREDNK